MKRISIIIIFMILLTSCHAVTLDNNENENSSENLTEEIDNIAIFYDFGTVPCDCEEVPEQYIGLSEKYKGKIAFNFIPYFEALKQNSKALPFQKIVDADGNEISIHDGNITREEIISMIDVFLDN